MRHIFPIGIGLAMGPMMLSALHNMGGIAALWFVLAHLVVVGFALALIAFGARKTAWGRRLLAHRPSASHLALMAGAMALGMGLAHFAHGMMNHGGAV